MKKLEEYVNENQTQINENWFTEIFQRAFKASKDSIAKNIHDRLAKEYPNFIKAYDELKKDDLEDKELIQKFNAMYEAVDKMKLSDDEKVFQKLNLTMDEAGRFEDGKQDEKVKKLDKEKHKEYYIDLQNKLKDIEKNHGEIFKKYNEAMKNGEVKQEDVIGKGEAVNEEDPIKTLAAKHKATLQDLAKLGGLDEKTLQGIESKLKAYLNESLSNKLSNFVLEEGENEEDKKNKLKTDSEQMKSLFAAILVAYYGLKNLKWVSNIDDLTNFIKGIENAEVKENRLSLNDFVNAL